MRYYVTGEYSDTEILVSEKPTVQDVLDLMALYIPHVPPRGIVLSHKEKGGQIYTVISLKP